MLGKMLGRTEQAGLPLSKRESGLLCSYSVSYTHLTLPTN